MVHGELAALCQSTKSVSSEYALHPEKSPGETAKEIYDSHHLELVPKPAPDERQAITDEHLAWARSCGRFENTQPSKLFLSAYYALLQTLEHDALENCCSPSLVGSTGHVPFTVIGPLPDLLRHLSNLVVNAKKEVFIATNYWKSSWASSFLNAALLELSKRVGERGTGEKIVVKIMFDRGSLGQFIDNHQNMDEKGWTKSGVGLPASKDMPHVDLQVVNFHRPMLGTFHCKFAVIDREIAVVQSNNVQDNTNLEMLAQYEGAIVDSLWDTFLISWHKAFEPPAPCRNEPAAGKVPPSYQDPTFEGLFDEQGRFRKPEEPASTEFADFTPEDPHFDSRIAGEISRMRSVLQPVDGQLHKDVIAKHLNQCTKIDVSATAPDREPDLHFFPFIPLPKTDAVPMAMCSRKPFGPMNNRDSEFTPQNECWLALIRYAQKDIFIQTPNLNAKPLLPALAEAVKRGVIVTYYCALGYNDGGELLPYQEGVNEMAAHRLYQMIPEDQRSRLRVFFYVAADQDKPIHDKFKHRTCHIKLLIADGQVSVQGSGNQDTQSWFHSQECNVMIDSPVVAAAWREAIDRNQNTAQFGRSREDGCWYDSDGQLAEGSIGNSAGKLSFLKGFVGIAKKAQGK